MLITLMKLNKMDCPICASSFNKCNRAEVQCFACNYVSCKECIRTFIKMSNHLPKCMNCNVLFTTHFMVRKLNRSWVSAYKNQLTQILTGIELGKLPDTQPYVEAEIQRQRLINENIQHEKEIRSLKDKMLRLTTTININKYRIRGQPVPAHFGVTEQIVDTRKQFIMQCPLDCRGFLSSQYKCGTCEKSVCSECLMLKDSEHVCIEENRLSAEVIKRESKGCPKCGARICKIDGCDQMFCTSNIDGVYCGTAFSWKTGKIETGTVHNPHYYELVRKGFDIAPRNIGDVQCGGVPNIQTIIRALTFQKRDEEKNRLLHIHRRISELVQYTTRDFRTKLHAHESDMRSLRVKYMMKQLNKEAFSELVYKTERDHQKNQDLHHILELLSICGIETFQKIMQDYLEMHEFNDEPIIYLNGVREYCNGQLKELSITYNCSVTILDGDFNNVTDKFNMDRQAKKPVKPN